MNTFLNQMQKDNNLTYTENGGRAYRSLMSGVYDMFAFGASYRQRSDEDVLFLFKKAFEEDETLALKCLFWIRDCRGGAGERRFFRVCMKWLAENYPNRIRHLISYLPEYGRWDELYIFEGTPLEEDAFSLIKHQLEKDVADIMKYGDKAGISLCAKWVKSCNASSEETRKLGEKTRKYLKLSPKEYRKLLSKLREQIKVLERLMSANRWQEIEFSEIPSVAGIRYKNAFARRDIIAKKYEEFAKDKNTKVNANVLYPYEVVKEVFKDGYPDIWMMNRKGFLGLVDSTDRAMINKYWDALPNYFGDKEGSMMCVVDTSGSMTWGAGKAKPIDVAIGLGLYCAERLRGPFANHYISFASRPQLIKTEGIDFVDKVERIYKTNLCDDTNLEAVFDLLLKTGLKKGVNKEDIPKTIIVLSDMEINQATYSWKELYPIWTKDNINTMMENMRIKWREHGLELPKLVYWNVNARNDRILDMGPDVSFVSGASPAIFKQICSGKTGWNLCLETICSDRYTVIK